MITRPAMKQFYTDNFLITLWMIIYAEVFLYICVQYISPIYAYAGFIFHNDIKNNIIYVITVVILSFGFYFQINYIKRFFIALMVLMLWVPTLCMFFFCDGFKTSGNLIIIGVVAHIVILATTMFDIGNFIYSKYKKINLSLDKLLFIMTVFTLFTICRYIYINGLSYFNLNLMKVYEYRQHLIASMAGMGAYLDSWAMRIVNPFCIVISLHKKKYYKFIFYVALQIILFGLSSHKMVLFMIFLILACYFACDRVLHNTNKLFVGAIFGIASPIFISNAMLLSMWRRAFLVPSQLNYFYYDYFSHHEFDWFTNSFLRHFVEPQYDRPIPYVIGQEFFGNPFMGANTGFFGSGYAHGGLIIVVVYSAIIGITINYISHFFKKVSPKIIITITLVPMLNLFISSDLPTMFLTGGILLSFLLLFCLSKSKNLDLLK